MTQEEKFVLWEKVMGHYVDSGGIEDLFEEGKPCCLEWEKIYEAEQIIRNKLGVEECRELDEIFGCWNQICMHVAIRMYEYGVEFGA